MLPSPRFGKTVFVFDLWGVALVAAGLIANLNNLYREPLGTYDESILLLNASLMNGGAVPYRDFYSNYPPGVFHLIGLFFRIFGEHVLTERAVGLLIRVAVALLAGHVAGLLGGRRMAWVPAGVVLIWLSKIGLTALASLCGLAWALGAAALAHRALDRGTRGAWLLCGVCIGVGTFFRHDFFVWSAAVLLVFALVWWAVFHRARIAATPARAVGWTVLAATLTAVVLWTPVFMRAGLRQPLDDLFFDQIRHVLPGRVLPMPALFTLSVPGGVGSLGFPLPNAFHELAESAILIVLLGPVAFLLALRLAQGERTLLCILGALSVAALPQVLGRTDMDHAIYGMAPAVALCWVLAEMLATRFPAWLPLLLTFGLLTYAPRSSVRWAVKMKPRDRTMTNARGSGVVGSPYRDELVREIRERTQPGEPIFVGLTDHRTTPGNELDLYFLANRPGSTRYLQFDPNVANRADVQQQMIADLEKRQTRLVIVSSVFVGGDEPNSSSTPGSDLLDKYLAEHFHTVAKYDIWEVRMRATPTPTP